MGERDFDVVVFGATGITGRNVAAYLAERCPETGATWAAAARNPAKLEHVLGEVGVSAPETISADIEDPGSLAAMASRTRVVLDLVGPYTHYGRPVIEACVAGGAHYADVSGEMPFVRRMIDEFDHRALEAGVKIVQVCGFESLPPDLSVRLVAETAHERWGERLAEVDLQLTMKAPPGVPRPSDMISGGTLQTFAAVAGADDAALVADPAALVSDGARAEAIRRISPIDFTPRRTPEGAVIAPMVPAPFINPAVLHRTASLHADEDGGGEPFRYREGFALAGGAASLPFRLAAAGAMAGPQAVMRRVTRAGPGVRQRVGRVMEKVLPSSGFGPTGDRMEQWRWRMSVDARTTGSHELRVEVDGEGHVGFLATARMLGEAGLLLAEPGATPERTGCLTPATALGTECIDRFERARLWFSTGESAAEAPDRSPQGAGVRTAN